jgi:hypothetical protein
MNVRLVLTVTLVLLGNQLGILVCTARAIKNAARPTLSSFGARLIEQLHERTLRDAANQIIVYEIP